VAPQGVTTVVSNGKWGLIGLEHMFDGWCRVVLYQIPRCVINLVRDMDPGMRKSDDGRQTVRHRFSSLSLAMQMQGSDGTLC